MSQISWFNRNLFFQYFVAMITFFYCDTKIFIFLSTIFEIMIFVFWLILNCVVDIVDLIIFQYVDCKLFLIKSIMTLIHTYFMNLFVIAINVKNTNVFSKRFVVIIKNNVNFNFNIIVNIFYINNKLIFHVMNETICFQIDRWLKNILAKYL